MGPRPPNDQTPGGAPPGHGPGCEDEGDQELQGGPGEAG